MKTVAPDRYPPVREVNSRDVSRVQRRRRRGVRLVRALHDIGAVATALLAALGEVRRMDRRGWRRAADPVPAPEMPQGARGPAAAPTPEPAQVRGGALTGFSDQDVEVADVAPAVHWMARSVRARYPADVFPPDSGSADARNDGTRE